MENIKTKICTKCKLKKFVDEFHKKKSFKDGLNYWCKKCSSKYKKDWNISNPEKRKNQTKRYRENNSEKLKEANKKYYQINKEETIKRTKKWRKDNLEKARRLQKNWINKRLKNDPIFRLNHNIKSSIYKSLNGNKNDQPWEKLVGYDCQELRQHLESQFKDGMTWENYGKWQIDHRIPISLFNITSVKSKGFKKCWALENLQPLWGKENILKRNKLFY